MTAPTASGTRRPTAGSPAAALRPGRAAICPGTVFHQRRSPAHHEFQYPVSYVWIDPDHPAELCRASRWWSASHPAPARFRRRDYGMAPTGSLAESVRDALADVVGQRPLGAVRMLTQVRRWGWLFNPITVYVAWASDAGTGDPVGAVLEVTNTPWKERHRYAIALSRRDDVLVASTDKVLHVSPFLDEDFRYDVRICGGDERFELALDVVPTGTDVPILVTRLSVGRVPPARPALTAALRRPFAPTHRVSAGIHHQALRLWRAGVPFVAHPDSRKTTR